VCDVGGTEVQLQSNQLQHGKLAGRYGTDTFVRCGLVGSFLQKAV
jgi:hypothetical protein